MGFDRTSSGPAIAVERLPLPVGVARDVDHHLRPGDRIEIVESRANGPLGRLDLVCALSELLPCVERATRDRCAESEHAQDFRVENPTEQKSEEPSGANRHCGSFIHWGATTGNTHAEPLYRAPTSSPIHTGFHAPSCCTVRPVRCVQSWRPCSSRQTHRCAPPSMDRFRRGWAKRYIDALADGAAMDAPAAMRYALAEWE